MNPFLPQLTRYFSGLCTAIRGEEQNTGVQWSDTFATLRTFNAYPGMLVYCGGLAAVGDGGQGMFAFVRGTHADDNANYLAIPAKYDPPGYWKRIDPVTGAGGAGVLIYATLPSGATDDWSPSGYVADVDAIVITSNADNTTTLNGLTGGTQDRRIVLANNDTGNLTIGANASGTAANNIILPDDAALTISDDGALAFVYDADAPGWRAILPNPQPLPFIGFQAGYAE